MMRQSQRTTPESEPEEFGSSDDLLKVFYVAAGVSLSNLAVWKLKLDIFDWFQESQIIDCLGEAKFLTPVDEGDDEAETEIITDADEAVADDVESTGVACGSANGGKEQKKKKKRRRSGGGGGGEDRSSGDKLSSKKPKVGPSQSSSIKTQSSSGSSNLHLTPLRKFNRHQKSSVQLPEFSAQSVSTKKSASNNNSSIYDPRATAVIPTAHVPPMLQAENHKGARKAGSDQVSEDISTEQGRRPTNLLLCQNLKIFPWLESWLMT